MSTASGKSIATTLAEFEQGVSTRAPVALDALAVLLKYQLKQQLSHPGSGRMYRRRAVRFGKRRKDGTRTRVADNAQDFHQASAPGESPAPDSNRLARSVFVERAGLLARRVGVTGPGAVTLELGGLHVAPRPYMKPALVRWARIAKETLGATFRLGALGFRARDIT